MEVLRETAKKRLFEPPAERQDGEFVAFYAEGSQNFHLKRSTENSVRERGIVRLEIFNGDSWEEFWNV